MGAKLLLPILIALAATIASAQADCPTISVAGPAGIINPGDAMTLAGTVSGADSNGLTYVWHIGGGELVAGQGTLTPRVKPKGVWEIQMTATLEVKGLPNGCGNSASEIFVQACKCEPIILDEFSISPSKIDKRRLDALVDSLGKYPDSTLFIIEYFRPRTIRAVVQKKVELIRKYLVDVRGLRAADFEIVTETSYDNREVTKLFVIPPGADKPAP